MTTLSSIAAMLPTLSCTVSTLVFSLGVGLNVILILWAMMALAKMSIGWSESWFDGIEGFFTACISAVICFMLLFST